MRTIGINETYTTVLKDLYRSYCKSTCGYSEKIPKPRGVGQGDPLSPKLFTATNQEVFKSAQQEEKGKDIDEKNCQT